MAFLRASVSRLPESGADVRLCPFERIAVALHLALCVVEGVGNEADNNVDSGGAFSYWEPVLPEVDRLGLLLR